MPNTPVSGMEHTTTVVIGAGLSGLAVASELSRYGVGSIVVDGLDVLGSAAVSTSTGLLPRCDIADPASMQERSEIMRHLRNYAASHSLDVRNSTRAVRLDRINAVPGLLGAGLDSAAACPTGQWAVHTVQGVLLADHIVVTRCGQSQLRRMLADLGIALGQNFVAAMRAIGMHLVGVGELITPTPKEVLRQAKVVGQAISAKVYPDSVQAALTGSFAAVPALA
ncbi:FAD-dependent monooxygenase [Arthrobacter sp. CJ23]|uniref:FAD-dependent monooxygenase n=1 Tax=Arthrobacter sp. CJ23 TaxID=2972479 RepID=UPI00215C93FB|nr:FAD-dependent monooxygenase [Arthrobacter sp. CJ23]UVJ39953.1 NAD(P)-binding protein [Arthrobacter sp. CJ23]